LQKGPDSLTEHRFLPGYQNIDEKGKVLPDFIDDQIVSKIGARIMLKIAVNETPAAVYLIPRLAPIDECKLHDQVGLSHWHSFAATDKVNLK
jgi:hypothetical protein